jgi:hypothetical protein
VVGHLLAVPARAHAELEPAAGEVVDRGDLLGGRDRVALDHEADAAADPQVRRGGRRGRHGDEQVVRVRVLARQLAAAGVRRLAARRDVGVLGEVDRVVAVLLDQPRHLARADRVMGREVADSGVHTNPG